MRREARKLERSGDSRAAGALRLAAAEQKLSEGSAISSAEGNSARDAYSRRLQQGLMRQQLMGTRDSAPAGAAALPAATSAPAPRTLSAPQAPAFSGPPAPGRINGQRADEVLPAMRKNPQMEPSFGADMANKNLAEKGFEGALADYQRRAAADNTRGAETVERAGRVKTALQSSIDAARARRPQGFVGPPELPTEDNNPALAFMRDDGRTRPAGPPRPEDTPGTAEFARSFTFRRPEPDAPAPVASTPKDTSLSGALGRDLSTLGRRFSAGGRAIGSAAGDAGLSLARGAATAKDAVTDTLTGLATAPARAASRMVPGETGDVLRRRTDAGAETLRRLGRNIRTLR